MNWTGLKTLWKVRPDYLGNPDIGPKTWLPLAAIIFMAMAKQIALFGTVNSYWGTSFLGEAWQVSQQIQQLSIASGWLDLFKELRSLVGLYRLFHLAPSVATFLLIDSSFLAGTVFPTICLAVSVGLIYKLGQLLVNRKVGLLAAFFWALMPMVATFVARDLFNAFYLSAFLLGIVGYLWGQRDRRNIGYLLSGFGLTVCLVGVPILGIILLALLIARFCFPRLFNTKKLLDDLGWRFWALATTIAILFFSVSPSIIPAWSVYQKIFSYREMIILLPLGFVGFVWAIHLGQRDKNAFILGLIITHATTLILMLNFQRWPQDRLFLADNLGTLGPLLILLPFTIFTVQSLVQNHQEVRLGRLLVILASLIAIISLIYGIGGSDTQFARSTANLLNIIAGLGALGVLVIPIVFRTPRVLQLMVLFVTLSLAYFNFTYFMGSETANDQLVEAAHYASDVMETPNIYVCPDELGDRIWYLQNYQLQDWRKTANLENPYGSFPRDIDFRQNGVLLLAQGCPREVTSLFDIQDARIFGEQPDSRIMLFIVSGD